MKYEEIFITDKEGYLKRNYPFASPISLTDVKECMHCGERMVVGDYKVYKDETGFEFICCPNFLRCGGTLIDWWDID